MCLQHLPPPPPKRNWPSFCHGVISLRLVSSGNFPNDTPLQVDLLI